MLAKELTVVQVGGRAVGAEGGGVVGEVEAASPTSAGVSEGDAGAVCTLELGAGEAGGGGSGVEEEQGVVGEEGEHPEERVTGFSKALSYLYSLQMSGLVHACLLGM